MKKFLLIVLILIGGCASAPWVKVSEVGGLHRDEAHGFSVELPRDWLKSTTSKNLFITKDGEHLQFFAIEIIRIDQPLLKKSLHEEMLPQEVAAVVLDNMGVNSNIVNLKIVENKPANINGHPGFHVISTFKIKGVGLRYKYALYGFMSGEWVYLIKYQAPLRYYFDRDVKTCEQIVASFKLAKTQQQTGK